MKERVEAILFTTGRYMSAEELARILNHPKEIIQKALDELVNNYSNKDSALEIQKQENKYKLNIKKEHGHLTNKLLASREFDSPTTKTLAIIAYKNPVVQSEIIKIRGNKAYDHIKSLVESGLVTSEKQGRTRLLKLTSNFFDYFDIAEKELKKKLELENKTIEQQNTNIKKEEEVKS